MGFGGAKGWSNARQKEGQLLWGKGRGSHHIILLYWNFIVSLTGYCKTFYRILPLFLILLLFYLLGICWDLQGRKRNLKCPKVDEINTESLCMVISACNHPHDKNIFLPTVSQLYIYCNWNSILFEWSFFKIRKFSIYP